jgi:hypothetical protein
MILYFDYLYYSIYNICRRLYGEKPEADASAALSALQAFSIIAAINLYGIVVEKIDETKVSKLFIICMMCGLIVLNYIRYVRIKKYQYEKIKENYLLKSPKSQQLLRSIHYAYVLTTIVLIVGEIIYFTRMQNR